jgi:hypothetical protein
MDLYAPAKPSSRRAQTIRSKGSMTLNPRSEK